MKELQLKYGVNPNQKPSRVFMESGELPFTVINGNPGYINLLDALNSWQLVKELERATNKVCAASFKHVSPTSAALGKILPESLKRACFCTDVANLDDSEIACAYARARGTDAMSSFGDFIALSCECDEICAEVIKREVSDGIIAPSYSPKALEILAGKRKGGYTIIQMDKNYQPEQIERKQVFGVVFEQKRNDCVIDKSLLNDIVTANKTLPESAKDDLLVALVTLKYTQSNSVCYAFDSQAIGVGAGQQSRIHCTRLAGNKADLWFLRQHPKTLALEFKEGLKRADKNNAVDYYLSPDCFELENREVWERYFNSAPILLSEKAKKDYIAGIKGVSLASDAFFPFADNIERAAKSGVSYIAQPCGSVGDDVVIAECNKHDIVMAKTGLRLFHH